MTTATMTGTGNLLINNLRSNYNDLNQVKCTLGIVNGHRCTITEGSKIQNTVIYLVNNI